MKLVIITQRDPIFIDSFISGVSSEMYDEIHIYNLPNFTKGKLEGLRKFLQLFGLVDLIKVFPIILRNMLIIKHKRIKVIETDWDVLKDDIENANYKRTDLLLSLSAPKKIDKQIIELFDQAINIHCGSLPEYAGMMPIFWQMYDRREKIDISYHYLAEEIDTGFVFHKAEFKTRESLFENMVYAKRVSAEQLSKIKLVPCETYPEVHSNQKLSLRKFPTKEQIRELKRG